MCIRPARRRRQQRASVPLVTHGTFCLLYSFYLIKKQLKVDTYTEGRRRSGLFSRRGVLGKTIALLFSRVGILSQRRMRTRTSVTRATARVRRRQSEPRSQAIGNRCEREIVKRLAIDDDDDDDSNNNADNRLCCSGDAAAADMRAATADDTGIESVNAK